MTVAASNITPLSAPAPVPGADRSDVDRLMRDLALDVGEAGAVVNEAVRHHLDSGGRRTRARLGEDCARALGLGSGDAAALGAAVELLHNASLIHDDLQDGARCRRGEIAVWAAFGAGVAVCAGDLLVSAAYAALASYSAPARVPALVRVAHEETGRVIRGQADDLLVCRGAGADFDSYRRVAAAKSGPLLGLPVQLALVAAGEDQYRQRARAALDRIAIAYQIFDDLRDELADQGEMSAQGCLNAVQILRRSGHTTPRAVAKLNAGHALAAAERDSAELPGGCEAPVRALIDQLHCELRQWPTSGASASW